jgi:DNA mismatch repair protein MutL
MVARSPWLAGQLVAGEPVAEPAPDESAGPSAAGVAQPVLPEMRATWQDRWRQPVARPALSSGRRPRSPEASTTGSAPLAPVPGRLDLPSVQGSFSRLGYIGQAGRCFLICQSPERLVIIDQHAAHERVLFERFRRAIAGQGFPSQRLLIPEVVPLPPVEAQSLAEASPELLPLGFEIEAGGERTVLIRALPSILPVARLAEEVRALAAALVAGSTRGKTGDRLEGFAATLACHAAVRAGDAMAPGEVKDLLAALDEVDLKAFCPHGRPAVMSASFDEIGRWFHRS